MNVGVRGKQDRWRGRLGGHYVQGRMPICVAAGVSGTLHYITCFLLPKFRPALSGYAECGLYIPVA
jgi:hypothetical protein